MVTDVFLWGRHGSLTWRLRLRRLAIVPFAIGFAASLRYLIDYGIALVAAVSLLGYVVIMVARMLADGIRTARTWHSTPRTASYDGVVLLTKTQRAGEGELSWVAVDDGCSTTVEALVTDKDTVDALHPGDRVQVTTDPRRHRLTGHVVLDTAPG